jgi:hypothetical protein
MLRTAIALTTLAAFVAPAAALAKDGDIRRSGTCSASSSVKIKLSEEDGRIETELEVDQNRTGVRWRVVLRRNGSVVARTSRVTRGRSGSFELRRVLSDGAGSERISGRAVSPSGEVCRVSATWTR